MYGLQVQAPHRHEGHVRDVRAQPEGVRGFRLGFVFLWAIYSSYSENSTENSTD